MSLDFIVTRESTRKGQFRSGNTKVVREGVDFVFYIMWEFLESEYEV